MAERATIFQTVQIGVESVYGTNVPANRKLTALSIEPSITPEVETYRATGMKFPTIAALNKEWTTADLSGPITYTELIYVLNSLLKEVETGTGAGTAKTWVFDLASAAADTVTSYSVEQGSAERAHEFSGGLVTGLTLDFTRDGCELSGTMIGTALADAATMTGTPTEVALKPVMPTQVSVKTASTQAGLAGATALSRVLSASWSMTDRFAPLWTLNGSSDFDVTVETEPTLECKLKLEADAAGMAYLTNLRAGSSIFLRIEATGDAISGGGNHSLTIDTACKVTDITPFEDADGVFAVEYTLRGIHDATWTKATSITLINEIAAL